MKLPILSSVLALLLLLAACSTPEEPNSTAPTLTTSAELLAKATNDLSVRQYLAKELAKDESNQPELSKEVLHSDEFYEVLASALEAQGDTQASSRVRAAFDASPHAYLVASDKASSWNVANESPLVAHFYEDFTESATVTALDAELLPHEIAADKKPDRFVLVLNEGIAEPDASLDAQAGRFVCNEENHNKTYTHTFRIIDSKSKGAGGTVKQQADVKRGWVLEDATIHIKKNRGGSADLSMVNAGEDFIRIEELKDVRETSIKFANELGLGKEIKIKVDNAISTKYQTFTKFTTDKVTERTAGVNWRTDSKWRLWGQRLVVDMTKYERCNSEDATTVAKATKAFKDEILRVASGKGPTGEAIFSMNPSHINGSLRVTGNGVNKSAWHGAVLDLEAGTYTVTGGGYDTGASQEYAAVPQTFTIKAEERKRINVILQPRNR